MLKSTKLNIVLKDKIYLFVWLINTLLIFADNYFQVIRVPFLFYTAISVIVFLFSGTDGSLCYLFLTLPFASAMPFKEIVFFYLVITICFKIKLRIDNVTFISFFVILALEFIGELRCGGTIITAAYLFAFLGAVIVLSTLSFSAQQCKKVQLSFVFGLLIAIILMLLSTIKFFSFENLISGKIRLGMEGYEVDFFNLGSNGTGMMCLFAISILILMIKTKAISQFFSSILIIAFLVFGIMTQSRAFLFGLIFVAFYVVFIFSPNALALIKNLTIILVTAAILSLIVSNTLPNVWEAFMERFKTDDITNGRIESNSFYISKFLTSPIAFLIGAGLNSYQSHFGSPISAHNATLEVFLSWGVIGFVFTLVLFLHIAIRKLRFINKKERLAYLFPFLSLIFMVQSTRVFKTLNSILLLGLAILCICLASTERRNEKLT